MDVSLQPSLPEQILNHPAHSQPNQLLLCPCPGGDDSEGGRCSVCLYELKEEDYMYACRSESHPAHCDFKVCIRCRSIKARVAYPLHEHPLCFLERVNPNHPVRCRNCDAETDELVFSCVEATCDFGLHLSCGPLPLSIPFSYSGYDMTLTLMDALTDGVDAEDSWCDICEEQRHPEEPVYHSSYPPLTATIGCVQPQIVRALQGHQGDLELRECVSHMGGVVLVSTQSSTDDDAEQVIADKRTRTRAAEEATDNDYVTFSADQVQDSRTREDKELIRLTVDKEDGCHTFGYHTCFKFSDEAFRQFMENVSIAGVVTPGFVSVYVSRNPVYTKVGSNFVVTELVPLYRQLIHRYGDFTANSPLSPAGKASTLYAVMKVIQVMLAKRIFNLSIDELCSWQWYFEFVRDGLGFEVQFVLDYLERAARCCYALRVIELRDTTTIHLSEQIERLAEDIDEDKPIVEVFKAHHKRAIEGSAFVKQCFLFKPSKLQWKSAGEFLCLDPQED